MNFYVHLKHLCINTTLEKWVLILHQKAHYEVQYKCISIKEIPQRNLIKNIEVVN